MLPIIANYFYTMSIINIIKFFHFFIAWQWGGWAGENWAYSQNRGAPLSPWLGAENWGHQLGTGRGNPANTAYTQGYGNAWGSGNGAIAGGALHGYGGTGSVGTTSNHRASGGNRKGYSQR